MVAYVPVSGCSLRSRHRKTECGHGHRCIPDSECTQCDFACEDWSTEHLDDVVVDGHPPALCVCPFTAERVDVHVELVIRIHRGCGAMVINMMSG